MRISTPRKSLSLSSSFRQQSSPTLPRTPTSPSLTLRSPRKPRRSIVGLAITKVKSLWSEPPTPIRFELPLPREKLCVCRTCAPRHESWDIFGPYDMASGGLAATLPPAILHRIFRYTLDACDADSSAPSMMARLSLSHVCGYWRVMSHSFQDLWIDISVSRAEQLDMVLHFARRAGRQQLNLNVLPVPTVNEPDADAFADYAPDEIFIPAEIVRRIRSMTCPHATSFDLLVFPSVLPKPKEVLSAYIGSTVYRNHNWFNLDRHNPLVFAQQLTVANAAICGPACFPRLTTLILEKQSREVALSNLMHLWAPGIEVLKLIDIEGHLTDSEDAPCVRPLTMSSVSEVWASGVDLHLASNVLDIGWFPQTTKLFLTFKGSRDPHMNCGTVCEIVSFCASILRVPSDLVVFRGRPRVSLL